MKLARRVSGLDESITLEITQKAKKMSQEGIDVASFAAGEPDYDTPSHVKDSAIRAINEGVTKYTPSSGTLELREAIADKLKKDNSLRYSPSQIVVSNGAKHSLYNIFQVICDEGDEVLIPAPYWLSYPPMVTMSGAKPVIIDTYQDNNFRLNEEKLRSKITARTKCLVLNSPSNPTGSVYSRDELEMISRCAVKHNFYVISDEIYEKLTYGNVKHISIGSLGKDIFALTVTVNGLSKSYSMTGWRIGYAAGPADIMKAVGNMQSHATSNPCSISQKAALTALTESQKSVDEMRGEFERRRDYMVERINVMKGISCRKPDGAFYIFCDISRIGMSSIALAGRLLEEAKVAVIPGGPFGADLFIRLSFATGMQTIKKGLDRIEEWIKKNG